MIFLSLIISIPAALLLIFAAIAFLKAKDVFVMTHITIIINSYLVPLLLIGIELEKFSWLSLTKIIALIILNLIITNLICYATIRRATINKITPDAENKT